MSQAYASGVADRFLFGRWAHPRENAHRDPRGHLLNRDSYKPIRKLRALARACPSCLSDLFQSDNRQPRVTYTLKKASTMEDGIRPINTEKELGKNRY